jgi:hypothetical protein
MLSHSYNDYANAPQCYVYTYIACLVQNCTYTSSIIKIITSSSGRACCAYGGGESCAQGFVGEAWGNETIGETQT